IKRERPADVTDRRRQQVAELPARRFLHQGLPLRERRGIAGIEAALPHDGRTAAQRGGEDCQRRATVARQYRDRGKLAAPIARRRAVRRGAAARYEPLLLHHAGCDWPRWVVEAIGWAAREFPALSLP